MGMSRSRSIVTLLVIDTLFFFLEITVGIAVHSLALVADSFHMVRVSALRRGRGRIKRKRLI